jgi:Xaa-Pro aminopeptidase
MNKEAFGLLRQMLSHKGLNSIIINGKSNIFYLTGFRGDGYLIVNHERSAVVTPAMFAEDAEFHEDEKIEVIDAGGDFMETFENIGRSFFGKRTGYESHILTCAALEKFKNCGSFEALEPLTGLIEEIREIKNADEINLMAEAQKIAEKTLYDVMDIIREGVEEIELANEIEYRMRKFGAERPSFDTIAATGPNSSKPHAIPSRRKIQNGDFVLIDMGACLKGYASDMTRTFVLGKASPEQKNIYNLVLTSQKAAIEKIVSGAGCAEMFGISNEIFKKSGHSDKFIHSLGHGIGIDVHETPRLSVKSAVKLQENMVVTVEPGLYFPGWGGVRIEDMIAVEKNSCRNMTSFPNELIEL